MVYTTNKFGPDLGVQVHTFSLHPTLGPLTNGWIVNTGAWRCMSKTVSAADPADLAEDSEVDRKQAAANNGQCSLISRACILQNTIAVS